MFSLILLVVFKKIGWKALIITLYLGILPCIFTYNTLLIKNLQIMLEKTIII